MFHTNSAYKIFHLIAAKNKKKQKTLDKCMSQFGSIK